MRKFISIHSDEGRFVTTNKGPLSRMLQESIGDVILNQDGSVYCVECKVEKKWTGNLFIEVWSNRRQFNRGWLDKLNSDVLMYYFLDKKLLYTMPFQRLKKWAYGGENGENLYKYRIVQQKKYSQMNDTWGRIVPIADLASEGLIKIHDLSEILEESGLHY